MAKRLALLKDKGKPCVLEDVKIGDTVILGGVPVLVIKPHYGIDLKKPKLIRLNPKNKIFKVITNNKHELEAFLDPSMDRKLVCKYLSLPVNRRLSFLKNIIDRAEAEYYNKGESFISDQEYDTWLEIFLSRGGRRRLVAPTLNKVTLPAPAGSLNKTKTPEEIIRWAKGVKTLVATPKLDGVSVVLHYDKNGRLVLAATRGNGVEGQDITRKIEFINNPPPKKVALKTKNGFVVRGEAVLSEDDFLELVSKEGLEYRNPRNAVAGIFNAKEPNLAVLERIKLYVYSLLQPKTGLPLKNKVEALKILKKLGFKVPKYTIIKVKPKDLKKLPDVFKRLKPKGIAADGIVLEKADDMGFVTGTYNPKWAVAWKPELKPVITQVEDIDWNISRHGRLKPRVRIKPVEFDGVVVTWVTGKNAEHIKEQKLGPGAKVAVIRSGDVIPEITSVIKPAKPALPTRCPECGTKLRWESVDLVCPNKNCPGRTQRGLQHFLQVLDVEGAGSGTAKALMEAGILTPEELLETPVETLQEILGPKKGKMLKENLAKALDGVLMHKLALALGAFPVGYGLKKIKKIIESNDPQWTKNIQAVKAFAKKYNIKVKQPRKAKAVFVFTGWRDKNLERYIEQHGGEISNTVNKDTTAVLAKDLHGSSKKLQKAKQLGIEIVPADKAFEYVRQILS